jgi:aryl-alcohol dehydrogenase-like predicted oxidoreductase
MLNQCSIYFDNLEVLAKWFRRTGRRNDIFLASKFGLIMGENLQLKGIDSSGEYCKKACEDSLQRLGIDCIDLCESMRTGQATVFQLMLISTRLRPPSRPTNAHRGNNASNGTTSSVSA